MASKDQHHLSVEAVKQNFFILLLCVTCLFSIVIGEYILFSSMKGKNLFFIPNQKTVSEQNLKSSPSPSPKVCTMEAKICPNGSSVGRTGSNCEFTPCPK